MPDDLGSSYADVFCIDLVPIIILSALISIFVYLFIYLFLFCLFLSSILPFCLIALFIYFYQHILFKCLFIFVLLWLKTLSFSLILALHSKGLCQNFNLFANKLLRRNHFRTLISACEKYLVKGFMLIGYTWLLLRRHTFKFK